MGIETTNGAFQPKRKYITRVGNNPIKVIISNELQPTTLKSESLIIMIASYEILNWLSSKHSFPA